MRGYLLLLSLLLTVGYSLAGYGHGHGTSYQNQHLGSGHGHGHQQSYGHGHGHGHKDYYAKPYYKFSYGVNDHYTYDQKYHNEHRDGDKTSGSYGLREADGSWRNVYYTADYNGFKAHVVRTPNHHPHGHGHGHGHGYQG